MKALIALVIIGAAALVICAVLTRRMTRAEAWYTIAAWASANGDAAKLRAERREKYLADVPALLGVQR